VHQAKRLAAAITEDSEAALQRYWHERDAHALPRFCFYEDQGAAGPRASFEAFVLSRIARDPGACSASRRRSSTAAPCYSRTEPRQQLPVSRSQFSQGRSWMRAR
jgi:hypothetical protein